MLVAAGTKVHCKQSQKFRIIDSVIEPSPSSVPHCAIRSTVDPPFPTKSNASRKVTGAGTGIVEVEPVVSTGVRVEKVRANSPVVELQVVESRDLRGNTRQTQQTYEVQACP